ncbi:hypothetical protein [Geotalea sp. SG265]|uniref:hypothetical protein n=1 Tax=Geotalea sp. SG265 TaxID=2922867 RepID=UPI001FAF25E6|nr:hypothetical protein [Geotalea sp. SG265]
MKNGANKENIIRLQVRIRNAETQKYLATLCQTERGGVFLEAVDSWYKKKRFYHPRTCSRTAKPMRLNFLLPASPNVLQLKGIHPLSRTIFIEEILWEYVQQNPFSFLVIPDEAVAIEQDKVDRPCPAPGNKQFFTDRNDIKVNWFRIPEFLKALRWSLDNEPKELLSTALTVDGKCYFFVNIVYSVFQELALNKGWDDIYMYNYDVNARRELLFWIVNQLRGKNILIDTVIPPQGFCRKFQVSMGKLDRWGRPAGGIKVLTYVPFWASALGYTNDDLIALAADRDPIVSRVKPYTPKKGA